MNKLIYIYSCYKAVSIIFNKYNLYFKIFKINLKVCGEVLDEDKSKLNLATSSPLLTMIAS